MSARCLPTGLSLQEAPQREHFHMSQILVQASSLTSLAILQKVP